MDEKENWLLGLSGGINSMAILCQIHELGIKPKGLYIFYAHFKEHSPDTFRFVKDGIRFARKHFDNVHVKITRNSIIDFFEEENIIPHPANSPCSKRLKIQTANIWAFENNIKIDLVGYVKHELKRRSGRQEKNMDVNLFSLQKHYPIGEFTDAWCFEIVKKHIGWYPAIYDILWCQEDFAEGLCQKRDIGRRVFAHNNCLPCKNMNEKDMLAVRKYFPEYHLEAMKLSARLSKYWGRDEVSFYTTFGRELGQESTCGDCKI
jgi:hypothetical protein